MLSYEDNLKTQCSLYEKNKKKLGFEIKNFGSLVNPAYKQINSIQNPRSHHFPIDYELKQIKIVDYDVPEDQLEFQNQHMIIQSFKKNSTKKQSFVDKWLDLLTV